jgi:VIT1/CCC1 family predicted Fe2+/Mn2+ transporter
MKKSKKLIYGITIIVGMALIVTSFVAGTINIMDPKFGELRQIVAGVTSILLFFMVLFTLIEG